MYIIDVAETSRIDGSVEGGYKIICDTEFGLERALLDLENQIDREVLSDVYPYHSLKWFVR